MLARTLAYLRQHVLALLALFIALGGTAWALEANTVKSKHIVNGQVKARDLAGVSVVPGGLPDGAGGANCGSLGAVWADLSPGINNRTSYYRDPYGTVHLRGVALRCGGASDPIVALPAGYRPEFEEVFGVLTSLGFDRVDVESSGAVQMNATPPASTWVALDGISFRCAPSGQDGCP